MDSPYTTRVPSAYNDLGKNDIRALDVRDDMCYAGTDDGWIVKMDKHFNIEWEKLVSESNSDVEWLVVNSIGEIFYSNRNGKYVYKYDPITDESTIVVHKDVVPGVKYDGARNETDDYLYFLSYDAAPNTARTYIGRLGADGGLIWTYTAMSENIHRIATDETGSAAYAPVKWGELLKIDDSGNKVWEYGYWTESSMRTPNVAVGLDGYVYVSLRGAQEVHKVDTNGNPVWVFNTSTILDPRAVHANSSGDVFVGDESSGITKLDSDGNFLWRFGYFGNYIYRLFCYSSDAQIYGDGPEIRRLGPFPKRRVNGEWKEFILWVKHEGVWEWDSEEPEPWNHIAWRKIGG